MISILYVNEKSGHIFPVPITHHPGRFSLCENTERLLLKPEPQGLVPCPLNACHSCVVVLSCMIGRNSAILSERTVFIDGYNDSHRRAHRGPDRKGLAGD